MCTKEEVRDVIRSEAPSKIPPIILNLFGAGIITLLGWLSYDANKQSEVIAEAKRINEVSLERLTGKIESLQFRVAGLKESMLVRSDDRWYRRDAMARNKVVDERFISTHHRHDMSQVRQDRQDTRIKALENIVKEYHNK